MSSLPDDIVEEIFSWLPVKCLLRLRCGSKSWLAIISSPYFIKLHLKRSVQTKRNLRLFLTWINHASDFYYVNFDSLEDGGLLQPVKVNYNPLSHLTDIFRTCILGSCDGLLCISNAIEVLVECDKKYYQNDGTCIISNRNDDMYMHDVIDVVYLWNPSTQKSLELPFEPTDKFTHHKIFKYGFGYDSRNDDYKVVRLVIIQDDPVADYEVKVYSLKSNLWNRVDNFHHQSPQFTETGNTVAGGAMHWMSVGVNNERSIVAFDLGTETYRVIRQPQYRDHKFYSRLDTLGGSLSMSCYHYSGTEMVDLWVQNGGENPSWSKIITLTQNIPNNLPRSVAYSKNGTKVLLDMDSKFVWYHLLLESFEEIKLHAEEDSSPQEVDSCLESLVSVAEGEVE